VVKVKWGGEEYALADVVVAGLILATVFAVTAVTTAAIIGLAYRVLRLAAGA
jgi:hypothetical protein